MRAPQTFSALVHASVIALSWAAGLAAGPTLAQDRMQDRDQLQQRDQDRIYGSHLMTQQERNEYRSQMRNLKTEPERAAFRLEHHKRMQERARERGMQLPDEPPQGQNRAGPGTRMGPDGGKGPGGGGRGR